MPSLKDLRNRIASVKSTQKITKAMQMVAVAKLRRAQGAAQTHLLLVCTGGRGLCGAFNTSIVRLAREKANTLIAEGKTVKIICVGKKGYDQLRRTFERQIVDFVDLRAVRTLGYGNAQPIARKVLDRFEAGEF